jgi:hypothetical protein
MTFPPDSINTRHAFLVGIAVTIGLLVVGITFMASVPPVSRDALTHHLALPKLYRMHGGFVELPDIPFSYYPMNLDLLYYAALATGNDILPKYIHFFFALLTAGVIYWYLRRRIDALFGLIGALLWMSLPMVVRLSTEVYIDLGLGFFSMAAVYALILWSESSKGTRHLIWAGVWTGLAMGTKYNALLMLVILAAIIPFIFLRLKAHILSKENQKVDHLSPPARPEKSGLGALLSAIVFTAVALVVFSPWAIRNVHLKGNPVYPMLKSVFNAENSQSQHEWSRTATMVQDTSSTVMVRGLVFKESFGYIALLPLRIFFEGRDDDPRHFDGKLNPFLPLFILAAMVPLHAGGRLAAERWIWFFYAAVFMSMTFFLAPVRIRYLLPILPPLVVLSVIGINNIWRWSRTIRQNLYRRTSTIMLFIVVLAMFTFNATYFAQRFQCLAPWSYLSGDISRDAYITERRPEYPLIQFINTNLPADARILAIFLGGRRYYFDRDVVFNEGLLINAIKKANTPDGIYALLNDYGVSDIFIRVDLFANWLGQNLSRDEVERFEAFWNAHANRAAARGIYALYRLRP